MNGLVIRVNAYHGESIPVGNIFRRAGLSVEAPVSNAEIVNDPERDVVIDLRSTDGESLINLDALIEDFQEENGCKISYDLSSSKTELGHEFLEFDVFEPSWNRADIARLIAEDLSQQIVEWTKGYPMGR